MAVLLRRPISLSDKIKLTYDDDQVQINRVKPTDRSLTIPIQVVDWALESVQDLINKPFDDANRVEEVSPFGSWTFYKSRYYGNLMLGFQNIDISNIT